MKRTLHRSLSILSFILLMCGISFAQTTVSWNCATTTTTAWTVPAGVTSITFDVQGARGGTNDGGYYAVDSGGDGARVQGTLTVTPGQVLNIYVGGQGGDAEFLAPGTGGFNGGGNSDLDGYTFYFLSGGGGGGASDIRIGGTALSNRVIVAGGGGGAGNDGPSATDDVGGAGGTTTGQNGIFYPGNDGWEGFGGTPTAGGAGGSDTYYGTASSGTSGTGGDAAAFTPGGGGGGGYYGGGGSVWEGGGGGSSYTDPTLVTTFTHTSGFNASCGYVAITYSTASCDPGAISGTPSACVGGITPLSETVSTGIWSSDDATIATVDASGNVTGVSAGTVNIVYTVTGSSCTDSAVETVTINALPVIPAIGGSMAVCTGGTTTLTETESTGAWTTDDAGIATVDAAGNVTGVSAGTVNILYTETNASGCTDSAIATVTVNALPVVDATTGTTNVCVGATTTLTNTTVPAGVWTSDDGTIATVDPSGNVTGVAAGTVNIIYLVTNGSGCTDSAVTAVTVYGPTVVAAIGGTTDVCLGGMITLTDATGTGVWSSDDAAIATVDASGNVTGVSAGTVNILYTVTNAGGCIDSAVVAVTVVSSPVVAAISGTPTVCATGTITLSDITPAGVWSSDDNTIATVDPSGNVTGVAGGTVNIVYTVTNPGGCSDSAVIAVTVNALPVIDPITGASEVCVGGATTLTNTTIPAGIWSSDDGTIATVDPSGLVSGIAVGSVNIVYTVTNSFGCTDSVVTTFVVDDTTVAPISGMFGICNGSTVAFSDVTPGGVWSSDDVSIATVDASGNVTGVTPGTVNLVYTVTSGGGCVDSAVTLITVNALPAVDATTGTPTVCVTGTTVLTNTTVPAGIWVTDDASIATVDATGTVTGVAGGTVNILYIVTNTSSCSDSSVTTVTVNALPVIAPITGTADVCVLASTSLTETTGGGSWSTDDASIATVDGSGNVTGVSAGTVNILYTVTNGSGCMDSAVIAITVHALPTVAAIDGTPAVCVANTIVLSDATPGGVWSSDDNTIATVDASGNVSGSSVGTVNIVYTVTSAFGCADSAVASVTVNPAPVVDAITGNAPVCVGSTLTLADDSLGGVWSSEDMTLATVDATGVVTAISDGTVFIDYTITNTFGCATTVTAKVIINPLPVIAPIDGVAGICIGLTTTLSDVTAGGTWNSDDPTIAAIDASGNVTTFLAGSVHISYTVSNSFGCTDSAVTTFTVYPLPVVGSITGITNVCVAATTTLADTSIGGVWSSEDPTIATTDATGDVTGVATGSVIIAYTVTNIYGCADSATATVNVLTSPPATITVVGDTLLCPGSFVVFNANTGTGLSYQWYDGTSAIPGATTATYEADATGLYSVQVTNGVGCFTLSSAVNAISSPATALITAGGPTTFCGGDSVVIRANIGSGLTYQWLLAGGSVPGATNDTFVVYASGDYSVVVTNAAGCSATSGAITVTVNPLPVVSAITGNANICIAATETLIDASGGGIWSSDDATIASIDASGILTGVSTGTVNILYTVTTASGCTDSAVFTVTVSALPGATVTAGGITTFCAGNNVVLTANAGAGYTYQWYLGGVAITGETNMTYTADSTGLYTVTVTNGGGCSSTSAPLQVVAVNIPSIIPNNPTSFCWGSDVMLTTGLGSVAVTGATYQWQRNGVDITGATGATYTANFTGEYSCNVSVPASCLITSDTIQVTQFPLPNPVISYSGASLTVANTYVTYQWYKNLVPVTGANSYILTTTDAGHYTVAVTDSNGCQNVADEYTVDPLSVASVHTGDIQIYPNPASAMVHIESAIKVRATIGGIEGKVIMNVEDAKDINISILPDGVYLIMLYDDNGQQVKVQKLVKAAY